MSYQQKSNLRSYPIYKTWSNGLEGNACFAKPSEYDSADLISSCLYQNEIRPKAVECQFIAFDLDRKGSEQKFKIMSRQKRSYGDIVLCHKQVRAAIEAAYPMLAMHISYITFSRHTGLSLVFAFQPFALADKKLKRMTLQLQERIGRMLTALGLGVDEAAYGLVRDVPNFHNRQLCCYRNTRKNFRAHQLKQKGQDVLSRLLKIIEPYKHIWDESKKTHPDRYLYPDSRIEKKLARFFVETEAEFIEYANQTSLAQALGISVLVVRKIINQGGLSWLRITQTLKGYEVQLLKVKGLLNRACALLKGTFKDWLLPEARDVEDGDRNEYIWRCAATMKMMGMAESDAVACLKKLAQDIPGHQTSKNCRRIARLVHSIYRNQTEYFDRYEPSQLQPIPGLNDAIMALDTKLGNGGRGTLGGILRSVKKIEPLDLTKLKCSVYLASVNDNGRITENLLDRDQFQLQRRVYDQYLNPLLETFFHASSFGSRSGKGDCHAKVEIAKLTQKHQAWIKFDVQQYFQSIDQNILFEKLSTITGVEKASHLMRAVTAPQILNGREQQRLKGIAVGSSLSNCLGNLYLTDLDYFLQSMGIKFVRLMDDITMFGTQKQLCQMFRLIIRHLKKLGLNLNLKKTRVSWNLS